MGTKPSVTYADAGVNIDAGNALVERIKPLAKATARAGMMGGIGGFGALFDLKAAGYKDPILVSGTDGVGTKLKLAQQLGRHDTIGIDLVAMCVNDLVVQGAEPLFFLDYFATGALEVGVAERVIAGIAEGCRQAGCALAGGETAEMPGMYKAGEYDLAGFAVGAVERGDVLPKAVKEGDILLGLASSGVHSNGYSLVRHILEKQKMDLNSPFPSPLTGEGQGGGEDTDIPPSSILPRKGGGSITFSDVLLTPTRIYVKSCLAAIKTGGIKAFAHITGGGITENTPRVLPDNVSAEIRLGSWKLPDIFTWLRDAGNIAEAEMLRTFNCGIGMIVVVEAAQAEKVRTAFTEQGETVFDIGRIAARGEDRVAYI